MSAEYFKNLYKCGSKKRYFSEESALNAAQKIAKTDSKREQINAYLCPYCHHWHWGHDKRKVKNVLNR